jgi:hypothetical protein
VAPEQESVHLLLWRTKDLIAEAKRYLSRNLSPREWQMFFGEDPYRKTFRP